MHSPYSSENFANFHSIQNKDKGKSVYDMAYLNKLKAGDLIHYRYGSSDFADHVGVVTAYNTQTQLVTTVEGNTPTGVVKSYLYPITKASWGVRGLSEAKF
jgi:cell wall-associated NlpC family hydrolase